MRSLQRASSSTMASGSTHRGPPRCRNCCCAVRRSSTAAVALVPSPALAATIAASLLFLSSPAQAHIAIEQLPQPAQQQQQRQPVIPNPSAGFDPAAVGQIRAARQPAPSSTRNRTRQQSVTASEALEALQQLKTAEAQFKQGDYAAALASYTAVVKGHPDLALTEYARLGQALCMYQEGSTSQALTELNELELELRGNPETHAALAAVLYAERPAQRWRAEQQWDIAVGFDARYADLAWVQESKRWPPKLVGALQQFLALR